MPHQMDGLSCKFQLSAFSTLIFSHAVAFLLLTHPHRGQSQQLSQSVNAMVGDDIILPCHVKPATDAVNTVLEWSRPDLQPKYVHVRRFGEDRGVDQNPSYRGRTSVSIDRLKWGDMSLKLSSVKISDDGIYRCFSPEFDTESSVQLIVDVIIEIAKVSSGVLECKSEGWYPEPEVFWLDAEGNLLPAGPTETVKGPGDLYTVSSRVTVEKRHSSSFTCRIHQKNIKQTRETHINIPDGFFTDTSTSAPPVIIGSVVGAMFILAVVFVVWRWRQNKNNTRMNSVDEERGGEGGKHPIINDSERVKLIGEDKNRYKLADCGKTQSINNESAGQDSSNSEGKGQQKRGRDGEDTGGTTTPINDNTKPQSQVDGPPEMVRQDSSNSAEGGQQEEMRDSGDTGGTTTPTNDNTKPQSPVDGPPDPVCKTVQRDMDPNDQDNKTKSPKNETSAQDSSTPAGKGQEEENEESRATGGATTHIKDIEENTKPQSQKDAPPDQVHETVQSDVDQKTKDHRTQSPKNEMVRQDSSNSAEGGQQEEMRDSGDTGGTTTPTNDNTKPQSPVDGPPDPVCKTVQRDVDPNDQDNKTKSPKNETSAQDSSTPAGKGQEEENEESRATGGATTHIKDIEENTKPQSQKDAPPDQVHETVQSDVDQKTKDHRTQSPKNEMVRQDSSNSAEGGQQEEMRDSGDTGGTTTPTNDNTKPQSPVDGPPDPVCKTVQRDVDPNDQDNKTKSPKNETSAQDSSTPAGKGQEEENEESRATGGATTHIKDIEENTKPQSQKDAPPDQVHETVQSDVDQKTKDHRTQSPKNEMVRQDSSNLAEGGQQEEMRDSGDTGGTTTPTNDNTKPQSPVDGPPDPVCKTVQRDVDPNDQDNKTKSPKNETSAQDSSTPAGKGQEEENEESRATGGATTHIKDIEENTKPQSQKDAPPDQVHETVQSDVDQKTKDHRTQSPKNEMVRQDSSNSAEGGQQEEMRDSGDTGGTTTPTNDNTKPQSPVDGPPDPVCKTVQRDVDPNDQDNKTKSPKNETSAQDSSTPAGKGQEEE